MLQREAPEKAVADFSEHIFVTSLIRGDGHPDSAACQVLLPRISCSAADFLAR